MKVPLDFYELLRSRISVSSVVRAKVRLERKSGEYLGLCPFHSEKTPSLTVNDSKRFYHCFGCGTHGDVIKFMSQISGTSYKDAALKLAGDNAIPIPVMNNREKAEYDRVGELIRILKIATGFFEAKLNPEILKYLRSRGISESKVRDFQIGFAPKDAELLRLFESQSINTKMLEAAGLVSRNKDNGNVYPFFRNRIIFPIGDIYGRIIGFGGRVVGDALPKYLNSPETVLFKKNEILYGEHKALPAIRKNKYAILVEGYMDAISLNAAGFSQTVATLGTAVTLNQIRKLWNITDEIVMCLDGDEAGRRAALKTVKTVLPTLSPERFLSFVELPRGLDPDDTIKTYGAEYFEKLLAQRKIASQTIWDREYAECSLRGPEAVSLLESRLNDYVSLITDSSLKNNYRIFFKNMIWESIIRTQGSKRLHKVDSNAISEGLRLRIEDKYYSEIELLEYAICALSLRFPELLQISEVKDLLVNMKFNVARLEYMVEWLLCSLSESDSYDIGKMVKDTDFYDTYLLLTDNSTPFLNLSEFRSGRSSSDNVLLFKILYKKHQSELLKKEYEEAIENSSEEIPAKSESYRRELLNINEEIAMLTDSFFND